MNETLSVIKNINHLLWNGPMLILLMTTHLFLTFRLKFVQKHILKGIRLSTKPSSDTKGETTSFAALATTLAATLGIGNIVGVSTAVSLGGPGSIFWIWLTGLLGMATTYAECYLGVHFRQKAKDGTYSGGPMYVLENGLHSKTLAIIYSFLTLTAAYGVGCSTQANSITDVTSNLFGFSPYIVGMIVAIVTGLVIIGGIKSIGNICVRLVPAMGIFYVVACLILMVLNGNYLLPALALILKSAFTPTAMIGGFVGTSVKSAIRYGIARGLFSNEAGIGTAAIAAASAKTDSPHNQALVSMSSTFWDTVVMCGVTGLVVVSNILKYPTSIEGASASELTTIAFAQLPFGEYILGFCIIAFALATLIGWNYFGEKAVVYLFGKDGIKTYKICYIVMIFIGSILSLEFVWELCDLINALMILPNVITIWLLHKVITYNK